MAPSIGTPCVPAAVTVPAQIRAARGLLNWSQDDLATAANVGLTTVRDIENQRRAADTAAMRELRRAFENAGVVLVPGSEDGGPGVRFVKDRPHLIRPPVMTQYEGMFFGVEWRGREVTASVSHDAMQDLGGFSGFQPEQAYQKLFAHHIGTILDATARALAGGRVDRHGRVRLTVADFPELGS